MQRVHVGNQPRQVAVGGGDLWVSVFGDNALVEVGPQTMHVVARIPVCKGPQGVAYSAGQVWVGCTTSGELADVNAASHRVARRIAYKAADGVVRAGSVLLVTSDSGPSTGVLDPQSGHLSHNVRLSVTFVGDANSDVAELAGRVWVSSPDEGALYGAPSS
jgi:DNA-binding beta-propeller fold protein YncE